jgi:threonine dehydratase
MGAARRRTVNEHRDPKDLAQDVSLAEVVRARRVVAQVLPPTPLRRYESLCRLVGADVWVKHENQNPTGTFKPRGGVNLMHHLRERGVRGVITYSTGNHGTSVATAARMMGIPAVVVLPRGSNPFKVQAIRDAGAELVEWGSTFEEAGRKVEELRQERGLYLAHPANEPLIIDGVGTGFLEVLEELPDLDVMLVPLGAGSEVAAAITVLKSVRPQVQVIAVQAAAAHNLTEGAGAATLRAAVKLRERLAGKKVAIQMSGGNASAEELAKAMALPCLRSGAPAGE